MTEALKHAIALAQGVVARTAISGASIELNNREIVSLADAVVELAKLAVLPTPDVVHTSGTTLLDQYPAELLFGAHAPCNHLPLLPGVLDMDLQRVLRTDVAYRGSWKRRGGTGAFHMLARKWDRLEPRVEAHGFDIFAAIEQDNRREGVIDDVRDLRRYLGLVEAEMVRRGMPTQAPDKDDIQITRE